MMPNSDEKRIRFIDSSYNELFSVPDGGKIYLTYSDGEKVERTCKFIDPTHFDDGRHCWHICEFAERMEQNKTRYAPFPMPDNMPFRSYAVNRVSGDLVLLKYGENGYFLCNYSLYNKSENDSRADKINVLLGISKAQAAAMYGGSMFGFDKPIADPENYNEDGTMKRMNEYDRSFAERIRRQYPEGTKIILDEMNDPYRKDMVSGLRGIVDHVDDAAQIHCIWQNGSSLALIPGEDKFHIDAEQEQDIQPEEQSGELEL